MNLLSQNTNTNFFPSTTGIAPISSSCGVFKVSGCQDIFQIIFGSLIPSAYIIIFALGAVFMLVSSIKIITSAGSQEQLKAAFDKLKANFVGFFILLLATTIFFVVISLVGIGIDKAADITNISSLPGP